MNFWDSIEALADQHNVLRHPFYVRWSEGELRRDELALYGGQYRHAVVALAEASASAATRTSDPVLRDALAEHAVEERAHVTLWDDFAATVGAERDAAPSAETLACTEAWAGDVDRPLLETLVALYTIESAQPAISATKRAGLDRFYGIGGAGAAYFELHEQLDREHAAAASVLITARLHGSDEQALLDESERVLRGNWLLLDGVERACGRG